MVDGGDEDRIPEHTGCVSLLANVEGEDLRRDCQEERRNEWEAWV